MTSLNAGSDVAGGPWGSGHCIPNKLPEEPATELQRQQETSHSQVGRHSGLPTLDPCPTAALGKLPATFSNDHCASYLGSRAAGRLPTHLPIGPEAPALSPIFCPTWWSPRPVPTPSPLHLGWGGPSYHCSPSHHPVYCLSVPICPPILKPSPEPATSPGLLQQELGQLNRRGSWCVGAAILQGAHGGEQ